MHILDALNFQIEKRKYVSKVLLIKCPNIYEWTAVCLSDLYELTAKPTSVSEWNQYIIWLILLIKIIRYIAYKG